MADEKDRIVFGLSVGRRAVERNTKAVRRRAERNQAQREAEQLHPQFQSMLAEKSADLRRQLGRELTQAEQDHIRQLIISSIALGNAAAVVRGGSAHGEDD